MEPKQPTARPKQPCPSSHVDKDLVTPIPGKVPTQQIHLAPNLQLTEHAEPQTSNKASVLAEHLPARVVALRQHLPYHTEPVFMTYFSSSVVLQVRYGQDHQPGMMARRSINGGEECTKHGRFNIPAPLDLSACPRRCRVPFWEKQQLSLTRVQLPIVFVDWAHRELSYSSVNTAISRRDIRLCFHNHRHACSCSHRQVLKNSFHLFQVFFLVTLPL